MIFLTAFLTGLFGSFHCAGMCGPIAFALPRGHLLTGRLIYNFARILNYGLLGLLTGSLGFGLLLAGLQQGISIGAGVLIILMVVWQFLGKKSLSANPFSRISSGTIQHWFKRGDLLSYAAIGLLNGLLPCGFVYLALVGSAVTQDPLQGFLFMVCFGLGTVPMMLLVSLAGQVISPSLRNTFARLAPWLAMLIGVWFIVRGLNLGIPYLSPHMPEAAPADSICH